MKKSTKGARKRSWQRLIIYWLGDGERDEEGEKRP